MIDTGISKLIECISKGIGVLYEPTQIRKKAYATAKEIEVTKAAEALADKNSEFHP